MGKFTGILKKILLGVGLAFFVFFGAKMVFAQNVTQGYGSDQTLQQGMIVKLKSGDGGKVQALTQDDEKEMLGVVVSAQDAPVSLSQTNASSQVYIATFGRYDALVSTQNGPIKTGDFVTISSLAGIGMKAGGSQQVVIGKALAGFDGKNADSTTSLQTSIGKQNVALGRIPVNISVAHNPLYTAAQSTSGVPNFLSQWARIVTNRDVSAFRIYASLAVLALCVLIGGGILVAGVRSSMIAIGRNPLAKRTIVRNLIQIVLIALIIFVIGVIAVYLLLKV